MDDQTFTATLRQILLKSDDWLKYDFMPGQRHPVPWTKLDHEGQLALIRSCFGEQDASANGPGRTRLDRTIEKLCRLYLHGSNSQRARVRRDVSRPMAIALGHFAWRMAVAALRGGGAEAITLGLVAVSIEDATIDLKDTLTWLALLYHAASRVKCDADSLFGEAASVSTERMREVFAAFVGRSPEIKSLTAFGFRESSGDHGATLENVR